MVCKHYYTYLHCLSSLSIDIWSVLGLHQRWYVLIIHLYAYTHPSGFLIAKLLNLIKTSCLKGTYTITSIKCYYFQYKHLLKVPISHVTFVTSAYLFQDNAHLNTYHIHTKLHGKWHSEISPHTNVFQNSEMSKFMIPYSL